MVTQAKQIDFELLEDSSDDLFDKGRFEKIRRTKIVGMPSRKARSARRAACKTPASRRAAKHISKTLGGKHRRRRNASW